MIWTIILSSFLALAANLKSEGKVHLSPVINSEVKLTVDEGFHFNTEAPTEMLIGSEKSAPLIKEKKLLKFKVPKDSKATVKLKYYVCDDANTICEPHENVLNETKDSVKKETSKSSPQKVVKDKHGFILNNYEAALKTAKDKNRLVLIDFAGSWCPPCIRLEHEVFPTKEFKSATKKYVLSHIDVDMEENYEVLKKYNIRAFPTLVVTNSQGEELARFLDFIPSQILAKDLVRIADQNPPSLSSIMAKAEIGDTRSMTELAEHYFKSMRFEEAIKWYEKAHIESLNYRLAQVYFWEDKAEKENNKKTTEQFQKILRVAIGAYPESFESISWRQTLAKSISGEKPNNEAKKLYQQCIELAQKWIMEPTRITQAGDQLIGLKGLVIPELYAAIADSQTSLGNEALAKEAWNKAIEETLKLKPSAKSPTIVIYLAYYMSHVKPVSEIEPWYVKLQKANPKEYTYFYRHAGLLLKNKEFAKALPIAEKSFALSYGRNRLQAGLLLAKVQSGLEQKDKAKSLLTELLDSSTAKVEENKRVAQGLSDYLKEIQK